MFSVPATIDNVVSMKRLWVHEVLRVYFDRLVDDADRSWFFSNLYEVCKEFLNEDMDQMFSYLNTEGNHKVIYKIIIF